VRGKRRNAAIHLWMPWLTGVFLLGLWELVSRTMGRAALLLPPPSKIAMSIVQYHEPIVHNAMQTMFTTLAGFFLAVAAGLLIGIAIGASRVAYSAIYPMLIAFNAVPKVAILPVIVLWCGIGTVPAIVTAFVLAIFPIIVNVATGLANTDPAMEDVMRSLGASKYEILTKIGLPQMMPFLFASLKIAITLAFVGSVLSETVASNNGIGFLMEEAASKFNVALVFAGLTVIAVLAILSYAVCILIENRLTRWAAANRDR
jgi:NitT/TauT family transport system permease protein